MKNTRQFTLAAAHSRTAHTDQAKLWRVVMAASLGTVFEWYDFYLYGTLAVFFGALFFPPGNETAALLASLAAFGAGFAVRPLGALVFGALGDRMGRKQSFLITMVIMGIATVVVGLLPTYAQVGMWAPILLVAMRLAQGLAVGGEYGAAATYVAEHAPQGQRGGATSLLQTTATFGFFLALAVILGCRLAVGEDAFKQWGWRLPFLTSVILLAVSVWLRMKLEESPVFEQMQSEGRVSRQPIRQALGHWDNLKRVLITLFGITTGMTVVWYTAQFYALFFLQSALRMDDKTSYMIFAAGLLLGTPLIVLFGKLSDRMGRKPIMIAGMALGALTLIPSFHALARFTNPGLMQFSASTRIMIRGGADCTFSLFAKPVSDCDKARYFFSRSGLSYTFEKAAAGATVTTAMGQTRLDGFDEARFKTALTRAGFDPQVKPESVNFAGAVAVVVWLLALVGMVYGPMAAFMVEMFPASIRSTSLSLPYHLGVGILGGFLPLMASALVVYTGDMFAGLWYPVVIAGVSALIGMVIVPETKDRDVG